jgi:aspartyl-tRNA(Asn)/glutamyl-tRNA(Gln) amidotransferase subunit C
MSLEIKDIEHLAMLSRIQITDEEKQAFLKDFSSILGYVSELSEVSLDDKDSNFDNFNITKADMVREREDAFKEDLLEEAPKRNADYVEVDQVF